MNPKIETSTIPAGTVVHIGDMPFELVADAKVLKAAFLSDVLLHQRNRTFENGCDSGSIQAAH